MPWERGYRTPFSRASAALAKDPGRDPRNRGGARLGSRAISGCAPVSGRPSASSCKARHEGSAWFREPPRPLRMESFQKRERDRRKLRKRQEKADRRRGRAESKIAGGDDARPASSLTAPTPAEDASAKGAPTDGTLHDSRDQEP